MLVWRRIYWVVKTWSMKLTIPFKEVIAKGQDAIAEKICEVCPDITDGQKLLVEKAGEGPAFKNVFGVDSAVSTAKKERDGIAWFLYKTNTIPSETVIDIFSDTVAENCVQQEAAKHLGIHH